MSKRPRKNPSAAANANDSDPVQAKKPKVEGDRVSNDGILSKSVWECEGDKGAWTPYSDTQVKEIVEALKDGKPRIEVGTGKTKSEIVFERMVQRNVITGWERQVRCKAAGKTDPVQWEWQSGRGGTGSWTAYPDGTSRLLEAAHLCSVPKVSITSQNKTVIVDMSKSVELTKTGKASGRKVRRNTSPSSGIADNGVATDASKKVKKEKAQSKKKPTTNGAKSTDATAVKEVKSFVFSGKAPVDRFCHLKDKVHVYCEGKDVWDTMLNQTNVMNNNNKYYLIQLLEDNAARTFYVWQRWGRVGFDGQNNLVTCGGDLVRAKAVFSKKFKDKTTNNWEDRDCFEKVQGKYDMLIMDYSATEEDKPDGPAKPEKPAAPESKLNERIQTLIKLICNVQAMEEMLKEMKYDTKKAPLGKLTTDQIKAGYEALKTIDNCIRNDDFGSKLVKACDAFYTRIPHCFGMKRPPLIRSKDEVKLKLELLEALGDIEIAIQAMKKEDEETENPIDRQYKSLDCDLQPLDHSHADFKMVEKYVQNTHAKTHVGYTMTVLDVFDVKHKKLGFKDVGNRMLLWHGSRLTNWAGILTKGLRIAPPEAPVTGYMFGKGIYFADMSSKSANYCFATSSKNVGLLLLSEVSLGKSRQMLAADYNAGKLPAGCHSVKGMGKLAPNPEENFTLPDGVVVPCGKAVDTGVSNPTGYTLNYNEYIVYDPAQVRMRYLVKIKFNYKY